MTQLVPDDVAAATLLNLCPCGSGATYRACCARFHNGLPAPTAELLMRARYSAYVLQDNAYIIATWHPATRPITLEKEVDPTAMQWLGLEIRHHKEDGDHATVEFVARYKRNGGSNHNHNGSGNANGKAARLHEISRFKREAGWWWYVDGSFPLKEKR